MRTPFHAAAVLCAVLVLGSALLVPSVEPIPALVFVLTLALAIALRATWLVPARAETERATRAVAILEAPGAHLHAESGAPPGPASDARRGHGELLRALAHELRTPLNSIRGFAEVLADEIDGPLPADAREEVALIRSAGEHLQALLAEVLDVAAGRAPDPREALPTDVGGIAREVARMLEPRALAKGLELHLTGAVGAPSVRVDGRRVRQILLNLVGNAVKYTVKGRVTIEVAALDGSVVIAVVDTGPGIAPSDRERIFTAWERAAHAEDGHGLGLGISRELATSIGAQLELESEVGRGSTFRLVLPAATAGAAPEARALP